MGIWGFAIYLTQIWEDLKIISEEVKYKERYGGE